DQLSHLVLIRDYSLDSSNTEPTLENYTGANVGVPRVENVADYNTVIGDALFTTRIEFEQTVSAINLLDDHGNSASSVSPSLATYHHAGYEDLRSVHVEVLNGLLQSKGLDSLASIDTVKDSLDSIASHALDATTQAPSLTDYTNLNVTDVGANILDYLNLHLDKEKTEGLTHYLKASDGSATHQFGYATAISQDGMTVAVLARNAPSIEGGTDNTGAVYLYRRDGASWQEVAIFRTNQTTNGLEKITMSADGRRVVIGAPNQAFVFNAPTVNGQVNWAGEWNMNTLEHGITASSTLAMNATGNILLVSTSANSTGRVLIYRLEGESWTFAQQIDAPNANSYFGYRMSLTDDGSLIAIGAYADSSQGRVYTYRYLDSQWALEDTLVTSGIDNGDRFGMSVSLNASGTRLAIGAPRDAGPTNSLNRQGAAYVYEYENNAWSEVTVMRALSPAATDTYGVGVALSPSGDKLMVVGYNKQSAYFYDLTGSEPANWVNTELLVDSPSATNDEFGTAWNISFNGQEGVVGAFYDDKAFQGVVINSDHDADFDAQDVTSTGVTFDNTSQDANNSGAAYVIAYAPYALDSLDGLQARVDAINLVLAWAAGGDVEPIAEQYALAEVTGVTSDNLARINIQTQAFGHTDMLSFQPMVNSINAILDYSQDGDNTLPELSDYTLAGIDGVNLANQDLLHEAIADQSMDFPQIRAEIARIDHWLVIANYGQDNTQVSPSIDNYAGAGFTGVTLDNLVEINAQLDLQSLASEVDVQALITSINTIRAYAADNTLTAPSVLDYQTAGISGVDAANLSEVNQQVDEQSLITVNGIQTLTDSLNNLRSYAVDNTQTAPRVTDYQIAGVSGVDSDNLDDINQQV
ncbi:hypothetical protein UB34_20520, partial [Photobacterium leiognathi]|uniref:FG-GAP repeat protein n=1 Tax=Photobacterium leiognathi TaxID=553611 RepID=UPI0005D45A9C